MVSASTAAATLQTPGRPGGAEATWPPPTWRCDQEHQGGPSTSHSGRWRRPWRLACGTEPAERWQLPAVGTTSSAWNIGPWFTRSVVAARGVVCQKDSRNRPWFTRAAMVITSRRNELPLGGRGSPLRRVPLHPSAVSNTVTNPVEAQAHAPHHRLDEAQELEARRAPTAPTQAAWTRATAPGTGRSCTPRAEHAPQPRAPGVRRTSLGQRHPVLLPVLVPGQAVAGTFPSHRSTLRPRRWQDRGHPVQPGARCGSPRRRAGSVAAHQQLTVTCAWVEGCSGRATCRSRMSHRAASHRGKTRRRAAAAPAASAEEAARNATRTTRCGIAGIGVDRSTEVLTARCGSVRTTGASLCTGGRTPPRVVCGSVMPPTVWWPRGHHAPNRAANHPTAGFSHGGTKLAAGLSRETATGVPQIGAGTVTRRPQRAAETGRARRGGSGSRTPPGFLAKVREPAGRESIASPLSHTLATTPAPRPSTKTTVPHQSRRWPQLRMTVPETPARPPPCPSSPDIPRTRTYVPPTGRRRRAVAARRTPRRAAQRAARH